MVILSVDYGKARTGIAICDKNEFLASPVCVLHERRLDMLINKILEIVISYNVDQIVLGLPKNMDGSEGESAQNVRELAKKLETASGKKVFMVYERLSTVAAHNYLNITNTRNKKRKSVIDCVSATIILQSYLDSKKQN